MTHISKMLKSIVAVAVLVLLAQFSTGEAAAQATRTWVSGVGDDANPCSRTAPCKTFAGAISKTAAGGQISVLDPAGYGAVTITKSISIVARGDHASALVAGTNAINISAAATDVVTLSGIEMDGLGNGSVPGLSGVKVNSAAKVVIDNCLIHGFSTAAVEIASTTPVQVHIDNSTLSNSRRAVMVTAASIDNAAIVSRSNLSGDYGAALLASGVKAKITVGASVITGSQAAFQRLNSGQIFTFGDVSVTDTVNIGGINGTIAKQ